MGISTNRQIAATAKIIGAGSFAGSLTLAAGTITPIQDLPYLLYAKVKAAAVAVPQAVNEIQNVTGMDILGSATGFLITHDVTGLTGGYPVPHVVVGSHPEPMTFSFGKFESQVDASKMVIVNNTAGDLDIYIIVYSDT